MVSLQMEIRLCVPFSLLDGSGPTYYRQKLSKLCIEFVLLYEISTCTTSSIPPGMW
jgi:hypothetical protein